MLLMSCSCESSAISISLLSATNDTLQLLAQILCRGETEEGEGLEATTANMGELQNILALLGMNVKLCPKLSSKHAEETVPSGATVVKEDVLELLDAPPGYDDLVTKKKSIAAMNSCSGGAFRQSPLLKDFKKNMVRRFIANKEKDAFEASSSKNALKQRTAINTEKRSSSPSVKFLQSGLLQDFKVNLVRRSVDGTIKKKSNVLKQSASESERTKCSDCCKTFKKSSSLWKHSYRQNL